MFCQNCGEQNADDALFCIKCGTKFNQPQEQQTTTTTPPAPQAGVQVPNIIIQQTTAQQQQVAPVQQTYGRAYVGPPSEKSRTLALILCLVGWLGLAGLHEFYAGRIGWGLVYFFTIGFFFIGTLVHTISILTGNYRDVVGAPITVW